MTDSLNTCMGGFWIAYHSSELKNQDALDGFACETVMACRNRLPEGRLTGTLAGRESDIRQDALGLLFSRYLRGNKALESATKAKCVQAVERHLNQSIAACLHYTLRRHSRKAYAEAATILPLDTINPPPSCPPILESPQSREANEAMLKSRALIGALTTGKITPRNYRVATMAIDHGMPAKKIAEIEGISTNAIYQQLRRIAPAVRDAMRKLEGL